MQPTAPTPAGRIAAACLVGTAIEWYDFFIYGTAAALVFGPLFFPSVEQATATLATLSLVTAGFLARPLGAIVVSHVGDRVGRRTALVGALLVTGLATVGIGLLPGYGQLGILAPALLVALRFAQGFAVGGEWGGAVLLAAEHAPPRRRGLYASLPQLGLPIGILTANLAFLVLSATLSDERFRDWGWRVPFLLSAVLVAVGLYVRLRIAESPLFTQSAVRARVPVVEVVRNHPRELLLATATHFAVPTIGLVHLVYTLSFATTVLGMGRTQVVTSVLVYAAVMLLSMPGFAALSDRVGRRPVLRGGSVGLILAAAGYFPLLQTRSLTLFVADVVVLGLGSAAVSAPIPAAFCELFPTGVRYSGASLGFQLSVTLGSLSPILAAALYQASGGTGLITTYLVLAGLISLVAAALIGETVDRDLTEPGPAQTEPSRP